MEILLGDCFEWLAERSPCSIHSVVTDPPYGVDEYTPEHLDKMRRSDGGVWRQPPTLDGVKRSPLPRFTIMTEADIVQQERFFRRWTLALLPVLVPGAHVFLGSESFKKSPS